jgi:hypothetical protein
MYFLVVSQRQADLKQIIGALQPSRFLARHLNGGESEP